ncbi:CopD family protein [Ramlibacter sp. PS4R-6]|uniref:CopD family protein n=1 Tax=Ramlibacter sp. PS4R-6 TaxID=3133438 RepID=UPI0030AF540B
MHDLMRFLHVAAAIFWMGGMAFMVLALRPALGQVEPPLRVRVVAEVLRRFFAVVMISIAVLLVTGGAMMAGSARMPMGWSVMAVLGVVMMLVFGHIWFAPWKRLKAAAAREEWPVAGAAAGQIALLAKVNLGLGWLAIAAVMLWH